MPLGGQDPFISGPKRSFERSLSDKQRIRSGQFARVDPNFSPTQRSRERTIGLKREILSGQKFIGNARDNYTRTNQKSIQSFMERMIRQRGQ